MPLIQTDVPLKKLTWMKVGGSADFYIEVKTEDELIEAFQFAGSKHLPVLYLGQGSNMILPDEGIRGLVIRLMNAEADWDLKYSDTHASVKVGAGLFLAKLIRDAQRNAVQGLSNFVGIPGTVGAAVAGNVGIPAEEFGSLVQEVEIFDGEKFKILKAEECDFCYRGSRIRDEHWIAWSVVLIIQKDFLIQNVQLLLERIAKQPKGHSCGSFFKNPDPQDGVYAGKLIEESGLKGKRVGGAFVSKKHANFIMNDGSATSTDILNLAREVQQEVLAKKGFLLENEVLLYGERAQVLQLK